MGLFSKNNQAVYRSKSADPLLAENVGNSYMGTYPPPPGGYPPSVAGYGPPGPGSVVGGYPRAQSMVGGPTKQRMQAPPGLPLHQGKAPKGMAVSKYPPWDPRWEKDHNKLLKRHQAEQQKLLKQQQKDAQKQLKVQQEQLKVQEAQMRRMQDEQMRQFQDQQRQLQEEQEKQLNLLQQYAQMQQQQEQMNMQSAIAPTILDNQGVPMYDYSTVGTLNLDYSTLGTLAYGTYGTYPGTQKNATASAAYANAYWTMLYQQYPHLFAGYSLPRVQKEHDGDDMEERTKKRHSRARYRKNRHSKEATLVTEDNRRYKSNPDSESSDLFISGSDGEQANDLKNQLQAQKNKLKKTEKTPKEDKKVSPKGRSDQPAFMAELQQKIRAKQKNQPSFVAAPVPLPPDPIYGTPAPIYAYVPGGPVPMVPPPPAPVIAPYIAPGAPQVIQNANNEEFEAVKLMENMKMQEAPKEDGPILPLALRQENNENIYDDGKSAIYAVPQKKRSLAKPKSRGNDEDDYEEQASGLIIDDVIDDLEDETGVVDLNKRQLIKLDGQPDDMMSAVYTADKDGAETIYATNEDVLPISGEAEGDVEQEEEVNMVLDNEDPPAARGAAELGVWREDHGTQRSPPPSYFAYSPEEDDPYASTLPQANHPPGNRRYRKGGNPQRKPNKRVSRVNNPNQNSYPAQPRRSNNKCTIQ